MIAPKHIPYVVKQIIRAPSRSLLTIGGVAVSMFLFAGVQSMQAGVEAATRTRSDDTTLVVYRKDRFCPLASRMPQSYEQQIRQIPGVESVVPMRIVVSNCRTSLDVVTFRGVPRDQFVSEYAPKLTFVTGSVEEWARRSDAALLGETLATRRGLRVGDRFEAVGITVYVAGVIRSDEPQDENVAYVHLDFLQFASGTRSGGIVTQFNVRVQEHGQMESVAKTIDTYFASGQDPTYTAAEKAFVARAATDVLEIVGFMRWLGWGCLAAVLALVANAIVLSVQDRIREHAILQTLGFSSGLIARLIVSEGVTLSLIGGAAGCAVAVAFLATSGFALSVEGHSIPVMATSDVLLTGVLIASVVGVLASLAPAIQAGRRDIVSCFRAV